MRVMDEVKQEYEKEVEKRKSYGLLRDNLVSFLFWPEANFRVFVYEFDEGFRTFWYKTKGVQDSEKAYNLYHSTTLVVLPMWDKVPTLYAPYMFWLNGPFDPKNLDTPLYSPPYSNVSANGSICTGDLPKSIRVAKSAKPEDIAKHQEGLLTTLLYNTPWTNSIPDRFHLVSGGERNGTPYTRLEEWESKKEKALEKIKWERLVASPKTWGLACKNYAAIARTYLGR